MTPEHMNPTNLRMERAIAEMQGLIHDRYPAAVFRVARGEDPEGTYLKATVDVEDTDEVVDVFLARLLEMQVEEGLPIYVIPVRPPERIAELIRERAHSRPYGRRRVRLDEGFQAQSHTG